MAWNDDTMAFEADSNPVGSNGSTWDDTSISFEPAVPSMSGSGPIDQQPGGGVSGSDLTDQSYSFDPYTSSLYQSVTPSESSLLAELTGESDQNNAIAAARQALTAAQNGDQNAIDFVKKLTDKLGDKGIAALVQGGFGMLSGASQGKMLEAKWKREDDIRNQENARKAAYAKPGMIGKAQWSPSSAQGTGLLGAKVG